MMADYSLVTLLFLIIIMIIIVIIEHTCKTSRKYFIFDKIVEFARVPGKARQLQYRFILRSRSN